MNFDTPYIKNGFFAGFACALLYLVCHSFDPRFYITQSQLFGGLVLLLFLVKTSREERDRLGGYASFGELLKANFIMYGIAVFIISIFTYILFNYINPGLAQLEIDITGELVVKMLDWFNAPEDLVDETMTEMDKAFEQMGYQKDFFTILTEFISKLFTGIILALIFAAIFKKDRVV